MAIQITFKIYRSKDSVTGLFINHSENRAQTVTYKGSASLKIIKRITTKGSARPDSKLS